MKRLHDAAWPVIGLGAVAVSSWLLFKDLRGLSLASLKSALFSISLARWLLAIGSTSLAYAALAWYDQIALMHLGRRLSWRYVAVASFTAYALAHNIGASVLSGAVVRYRAYSEKGLSVGEIGVLEVTFLRAMPDAPQANVVAALLVFRLLYLILPLIFALIVVLDYERKRWRAPLPTRGVDPDGPGNFDQ